MMMQHLDRYVLQQREHIWKKANKVMNDQRFNSCDRRYGKYRLIIGASVHHLGAQVIGVRKHVEQSVAGVEKMIELKQLDEVLPCADAVILCLPSNEETNGFFTHRLFSL